MNKKVEKAIGKALAASLVTGVAASVAAPVSAAEIDFNALYNTAYKAVVKAKAEGTQAAINEARTAINALKGTKAEFAVGEFSKQVDTVQGPKLVAIVKAIMKAQASVKQADINAAKALIEPELPAFWKNSYSQATDNVQRTLLTQVDAAVKKAAETKTAEDIAAAKALVDDLKTAASATIASIGLDAEKALAEVKVAVKVDSVAAVGAKKLEVKFNTEVDTAKAVVTVNKGTSNVAVTSVTFAADKKSAVVELTSKLTEGTYTVKVAGVADAALTGNTAVQNEAVTKLEVLSSTAVVTRGTNSTEVTTGYQVLNQYNEKMSLNTNLVVTSSKGVGVAANGVLTVNGTNFNAGDKFTATIVEPNAAKFVTQELTVGLEAKASDFSIVGLLDKDANSVTTIKQEDNANDFFLKVDVKDQYGTALTTPAVLENDLIATSSNPNVVSVKTTQIGTDANGNAILGPDFVNSVNAKDHVALALDVQDAYGSAIITLISKSTGKSVQYTVNVSENVKLDAVQLGAPTASLVAGGDTVLVPVEVTDNKGNLKTKASDITLDNANTPLVNEGLKIDVTGGTFNRLVDKDGGVYAEITVGSFAGNGTLVVTAATQIGKVDTEIVQVKATAVPNAILGISANTQNTIFKGESVTLGWGDLVLQDQYGRAFDQNSRAIPNTFGFTVTQVDANNNVVSVGNGSKTVVAANKGTEVLTLTLTNGNAIANSSTDVTFRTVEISELSNFGAEVSGKLYANVVAQGATDNYTKELKVYGLTSDGKKVYLPKQQVVGQTTKVIYNVVESSSYVTVGVNNTNYGIIDGVKVTNDGDNGADKDVTSTATLTFVINDNGYEFNKNVEFSEVAPVVDKVEYKVGNDTVTSIELAAGTTAFTSGSLTGIVVTDDYGVNNTGLVAVSRLTISDIKDNDADGSFVVANNGVISNNAAAAVATGLESGDTFKVTAVVGTKTLTLNVKVN